MVIDALKSNDPQMQSGAIAIVRDIPGPEVTKALVQELPKLPATGQVQLLSVLGDRGDVTALPAVIEAGKSQEESVRVAALRALGQLGGVANVAAVGRAGGREQRRGAESRAGGALPAARSGGRCGDSPESPGGQSRRSKRS